jgi:general secretion pathway protein G
MFISHWLGQISAFRPQSNSGSTANSHEHIKAQNKRSSQAGFTLIEIMVVIAIIGILATMIVPKIMGRPDEARATAAKQDVGTIIQALKLYRLDIGRYPSTEQGLKALVEKPVSEPVPQNWKAGGYLESLPKDPWGNVYQYSNPGTHGEIDVYSFGADGKPGGTALDTDIGNWQATN